jgi:hypothetical protein
MTSQSRHRPSTAARTIPPSHPFVHLVTLAEAAERSGLSTKRLKGHVRRRQLRAFRVGDLVVFRVDELDRLVALLDEVPPRVSSGRTAA